MQQLSGIILSHFSLPLKGTSERITGIPATKYLQASHADAIFYQIEWEILKMLAVLPINKNVEAEHQLHLEYLHLQYLHKHSSVQ